jgi:hypothetical protein
MIRKKQMNKELVKSDVKTPTENEKKIDFK